MKREFISIDGLKKVLSPKELKNILGGTGKDYSTGCCYTCGGDNNVLGGATDIYDASACFDFASNECGGDLSTFICYPCGK